MTRRRGMILALLAGLAIPTGASAATTDVASASATVAGQVVTFTQTTPCTRSCRLRWTWWSGTRLGTQLGEGSPLTYTFPVLTTAVRVQLDLSQSCAGGGGRIVCHSYDTVYVTLGQ